MTNDTTYREKGRAVFLAAIMVLSVLAMSAALTGGAAASHTGASYDVVIDGTEDSPRVWDGQTIRFNLDASQTYTVIGPDGGDLGDIQTNGNSNYSLDTSTLGPTGDYSVENSSSGATAANFTLTTQDLSASFGSSSINTGQNTTLTLNTNRVENFTVVASSGDADVATVFGNQNITNVSGGLGASTTINATTAGLSAGNHSFTFEAHDSDASATANLTVQSGTDADATFAAQSHSATIGDETSIDLNTMGEPSEIWLNITDEEGFYDATINLTNIDYSEDSSISLTWNTANGSQDAAGETLGFTADDADVGVEAASGAAIDAGDLLNRSSSYTFESFVDDPMDDGEFRDVASVRVNARSTGATTIMTAPQSAAHGNGNVTELLNQATEDSTIAKDDLVLVQVEATGLYGYMADDVADFNTTGGLNLTISETNVGPYSDGDSVDIQDISGDATLYKQPSEGQFIVAIDSGVDNFSTGSSWDAEFSIHESNEFVDSAQTSSASLSFEERMVEITGNFSDDTLELPATSDAELTAESNVAPGTSVDVRMNFPFEFVTASGTVADDGTFATTADLSGYDPGTQFTTRVRVPDGDTEDQVGSVITAEEVFPSFAVSANAVDSVNQGEQAQLGYSFSNDGDGAGTVEYTVTVDGQEVDSGTAQLDPGASTNPASHEFDTSSAGDIEWEISTQHDSVSGTLTVQEDTGDNDTTGDTGDDTTGDDTTGDDTTGDDTTGDDTTGDDGNATDGDGDDGDDDGDGGQPGFGLVVALFALIGAALLALRRQN